MHLRIGVLGWSILGTACAGSSDPRVVGLAFEPALDVGGSITATYDRRSDDAYRDGTWVLASEDLVGQFHFTIQNVTDRAIEHVGLAVTINDPSLLTPIPIKIANTLFLREHFVLEGPPYITEDQPYRDDDRFPGKHAHIGFGKTLQPGETYPLEVILIGNPGIKLHIEAAGEVAEQFAVSAPEHEITFMNRP